MAFMEQQAFDLPLLELTAPAALLEAKLYGPETNDAGSFISMDCVEMAFTGSLAIDDDEHNKGPWWTDIFLFC